jgi:hypothetical protein
MTALLRRLFLPGEHVPASKAYEEVDANTWVPLRRVALLRGDRFPPPEHPGSFFTVPVGADTSSANGSVGAAH